MCMDKFVGTDKFCGHETLTCGKKKKKNWVCDVGSWKIFVVMILAM